MTSLATLVVGLGAVLVVGNLLLEAGVQSEGRNLLRARVEAQVAALAVGRSGLHIRETANDAVLDRQAWVMAGTRVLERPAGVSRALDSAAVALGRQPHVLERSGPGHTLLRVQPITAPGSHDRVGAVVAAVSNRPLERLERDVLLGSLVVAALVVVAGGLAIRGALDGALNPVVKMIRSAERWGAHDLDRRFDLGPARDELTGLAATLDGLLDRIAASRRHEQRFASEVAHELRTPLAAIRARAELAVAAEGSSGDAERAAALGVIVERADELARVVDTLIGVARGELGAGGQTTDVAALVREFDDVTAVLEQGLPRAEGEPEIVRRALTPLVENARRHCRARVTLHVETVGRRVRIRVHDDGPGLPPGSEERAFAPGWQEVTSDGTAGLGLALARRLARSCGGDVRAEPGPGGNFVLELPAAAGTRDSTPTVGRAT